MLEEQGQGLITGSIKKFFKFLGNRAWRAYESVDRKVYGNIKHKNNEVGKKSVRDLIRKGRDLKLTEVINDKEEFKAFCKDCKKEGLAFAVKLDKDGGFRMVYQGKDAVLIEQVYKKVKEKELNPKFDIKSIISRNKQLMETVNSQEKHKQREDRTR